MWNAGKTRARMIELIAPAGFEGFFKELSDMTAAGPFDLAVAAQISQGYGLQFAQPEWLPGVIARYGLTPPTPPPTGG